MSELSPSQKEHWQQTLEDAERQVARAKEMLGIEVVKESVEVK